jgi:CRP-like cAMP-binding protein
MRSVNPEILTAARHNRLLRSLPQQELSAFLDGSSLLHLKHHQVLYRADTSIRAVYFPLECVVSILAEVENTSAETEEAVEIATVGNEGVAGVSAILGLSRAFGRTIVQVAGEAIRVNANKASRMLCEMPHISGAVHRYIYAFIRQIAQAGLCYRHHTAEERCARWLLMTHDRAGTDEFVLTQDFLGTMMAARRPTVNLAIAALRKAGALEYTYRKLRVLDRRLLESFSCPCYQLTRRAFDFAGLFGS